MAERTPGNGCGGFTLAEVLVALAVLSIGLLGAAALAVDTVRAQHRALLKTQAQRLAADFGERLRGNRAGLPAYREAPADFGCVSGAEPGRVCAPGELARHELAEWLAEIARALPEGGGAVTLTAANSPAAYAITIRWRWREREDRFSLEGWL
jgi:type IV pilus assembly protein PilV